MLAWTGCAALVVVLSGCGGGGPKLDAAKVRLELRYPVAADPDLRIIGQESSAPRGATVSCRTTDERLPLGRAVAAEDGSFVLVFTAPVFPLEALSGDFMDLNRVVECRANGGPWVSPLRPPLVAIG